MKHWARRKALLAAMTFWGVAALAAAQAPEAGVTVVHPDGQRKVLSASTLTALPREPVSANDHDKPVSYAGSDLREVLKAAGFDLPDRLHGPLMRRVVLVQAADGYAAAFALAELDPTLGDRRAFLVDRMNNSPLGQAEGPWRLVVPRDARAGRWVRQVTRISVIDLP